ncbi:MAG: DinB family protein [Bacteroidota bacterium]
MTTLDTIREKAGYNLWANQQLTEWLRKQDSALYVQPVTASFPSINKLMHHIMEAEKYYCSILMETEVEYEKEMATDKIFGELTQIDQKLLAWIDGQSSEDMETVISLKRSPFVETYSRASLLTHVFNHSTYHRGQLVALRHQLGIDAPPRTDYYRYLIALSIAEEKE